MKYRSKTGWTASLVVAALSLLPLSGCTSVGPGTIQRDRPAYGDTLAQSWKDQMLLNVVKLRYADVPVFLDVTSVINQYAREGQLGINTPGWDRPNNVGPPVGSISGRWSDRPTITYNPLNGDAFSRSLLTPIPPSSVMSLIQAGWPANFVFRIAVRSINNVHNGSRTALFSREQDPDFKDLAAALEVIQREVGIGVRVVPRADGSALLLTIPRALDAKHSAMRKRITEILGITTEATEYRLVYGPAASDNQEIAMLTRSMLEIIGEISTFVQVPAEHIEVGRVLAISSHGEEQIPIRILSGSSEPTDSYAAIEYRGYWYWIEDTDFRSKRVFTFLLIMLSLAETGDSANAPILTVSTGG